MKKIIVLMFFALSALSLVSGCSSDDSTPAPSTLSGTAATGAPIDGTVTVKDANGVEKDITTGTDGSFTLDVAGMTPPYLLKIMPSDGTATLYSYATEIGQTVNLTSTTNLAMFIASGKTDLDAMYGAWDGTAVTAAAVDAAEATVRANLEAQITAAGVDAASLNLFTSAFSADGTGIDAVMDDLKVTIDAGAGTFTFTDASDADLGFDENIAPIAPPTPPAPGDAISILTVEGATHALNGTYSTVCYDTGGDGQIDSLIINGASWVNSSAIYSGDTSCANSPSSTQDIAATVTKGSTKAVTWVDGMDDPVDPMLAADGATSMVGTTVTLLNVVITASYDTNNIPIGGQFSIFYVVDDTSTGLTIYRDDDADAGLASTADPYIR